MDKRDVFLGALPDDDVVREIVGYGGMRRAPSGATEMQIQVHWAAVRSDGRFGEGCEIHSSWIGCGRLAIVPIGSRWRRRMQVKPPFVPVRSAVAVCLGVETIGLSVPKLDLDYYPFDLEPDVRCFRLELDGDAKKIALVPVLEVIRAVFGCRSGFLRQMFDGLRDPALMRRRFLFDRARSTLKGRIVEVYGHSQPTEREAWLAAMMTASDVFRASHDGVFARVQAGGGFAKGVQRFVETGFPFAIDNPIGLAFESRRVEIVPGSQMTIAPDGVALPLMRRTTRRQVITRIRAFESVSPFDVVTYSWPRFITDPDLPARGGRTFFGGSRSIVMVDSIAPGTLRATLRLGVEGAAALGKTGVVFISRPRIMGDQGPSSTSAGGGGNVESPGSTADPHSQGNDDVTPVEFDTKDPVGDPSAALGKYGASIIATDKAIHSLLADRGWSADGLSDEPGLRPPVWPIAIGKSVRHVVEVEVSTPVGSILIYEAGSVANDKRALGFVAKLGLRPFTDADLERVREQILIWHLHWLGNRYMAGFVVKGLSRNDTWWEKESIYASKIGDVIDAMIVSAGAP